MSIVFGNKSETKIRKRKSLAKDAVINHVLLGTRLEVLEEDGDWLKVDPFRAGRGGWVHRNDVRDNPGVKVFYVDVGQGDGAIVEHPDGVMLIDGGPGRNLYSFLVNRYKELFADGEKVHIEHLVVSHPDQDHYEGFVPLINDQRFTFGTIYHNGIFRYSASNLPTGRSFDLGRTKLSEHKGKQEWLLTETCNGLSGIKTKLENGDFLTAKGNKTVFHKFWLAAITAKAQNRLKAAKRITYRDKTLPKLNEVDQEKLHAEILGPITTKASGAIEYCCFPATHSMKVNRAAQDAPPSADSSHTRNGHSIVLKLTFGDHTFLMGGDLNIPAQCYLLDHYGNENPFRVDVAKACHHGSSDFHVDFLEKVRPKANVVSSGDNKSFDHPVADAMGAMARHTSGRFPLLFSTELARAVSIDKKTKKVKGKIHYGLINARSNGDVLTMAQMKEQRGSKLDIWDSFTVPWHGAFREILSGDH